AAGGHRPAPEGAGLLGKVPGLHRRPLRMSSQRHSPEGTTPAHQWCVPDLTSVLPKDKTYGQVLSWSCIALTGCRDLRVDDICHEAGVSTGAFCGYFPHKQTFLLALVEDDAERVEETMLRVQAAPMRAGERLQSFAMLQRAQEPGRVQLAADIWSRMQADATICRLLVAAIARRRDLLRSWLEVGVADGELVKAPANALASLVLAFGDGLTMHAGLDPQAFQWDNIRRALDILLCVLQPA
ncbi:MAG: TetR/AcrR family transcriptional regulator, partial [Candidatus Dormibacteria bacterium]